MEPHEGSVKERIYDAFRLLRRDLRADGRKDDLLAFTEIAGEIDLPENFHFMSSEEIYASFKLQWIRRGSG